MLGAGIRQEGKPVPNPTPGDRRSHEQPGSAGGRAPAPGLGAHVCGVPRLPWRPSWEVAPLGSYPPASQGEKRQLEKESGRLEKQDIVC